VLYVCNVEEGAAAEGNAQSRKVFARAKEEDAACVVVSAKIESEIAVLPAAEQKDYLEAVGYRSPGSTGLSAPATSCCGSSPILRSAPRRRAPGRLNRERARRSRRVIHTDFEKGFIRAETIAYADFTGLKGEAGAREAGKLRLEGKDYLVADGDVLHFRFNN